MLTRLNTDAEASGHHLSKLGGGENRVARFTDNVSASHGMGMVFSCKSCKSAYHINLKREIGVRFPGLEGLNKPIASVFQKFVVCLDCGFTEFTILGKELGVLLNESSVDNATVSTDEETVNRHLKIKIGLREYRLGFCYPSTNKVDSSQNSFHSR
jgi:hypothetical protein